MPTWITSYFLNPTFVLPGAALIAAPIIIHLINRMRYRRVKWAAMEFLLESQQRNRRRLLLEQLLLLLLRIAVVVALVALIARPIIDPEQLSLFQGQKTHHVVLLDDSGSMRDRWGETTAFANALDVVRKIAAEGARRPGTQALTLLMLSKPSQPLFTMRTLDPAFVTELEPKLENLRCSHRTLDLTAGLQAAEKLLLDQPGSARNFHLISDFRRRDWEEDASLPPLLREMDAAKIAVNLIKTVPQRHPNLGVTELSGSVDVAAANVPLRLKVGVENFGDQVAKNVRLTILADGKKLPVSIVIDSLDGGKETSREFDVVFPTTGPHEVQVSLPADAIEADNTRYLSVNLPETNPILIINGDPSSDDGLDLLDAMAPAPGLTGFSPTMENVEYLRRHPLDRFQCIFMLNVGELPPDAVHALEDYVAAGGGLAWYLGEQVRPAFYNDKLFKRGEGLFPARLAAVTELPIDDTNPAPDLAFSPHPIFLVFEGQDNSYVKITKINRYFSTAKDWKPGDGVLTIASLRNKAPLFFEHKFGKGRVITCLTSFGSGWSNWQLNPSYVVVQLEVEKYIARSEHTLDRRVVGDPIRLALDVAVYSPVVEVRLPDGSNERLTAVVNQPGSAAPEANSTEPDPTKTSTKKPELPASDKSPAPSADNAKPEFVDEFANTDSPGVYTVVQKRLDGGDDLRRFAYNAPESESFLEMTTSDQIKQRVGPDVRLQIQEVGIFDWIHGEQAGQEIMDIVLLVLLVFLLAEQLLALKLSYHPKPAGARA